MTEKFEFIDGEKDNYPLVWMFAWMDISKSGYYEWRGRPDSVTARRRAGLKELIQQIFDEYDETYGYRRIHAELNRRGVGGIKWSMHHHYFSAALRVSPPAFSIPAFLVAAH